MLLVGATARVAAAPAESIVVAGDDAAFRGALSDAMASANIAIVTRAQASAPALTELARESRALADDAGATATVWLVVAPEQATLVTYDRGVDRMLVRALPFATPLSPEHAAEAARMARTMLRALRITPDTDLPVPLASEAPATHVALASHVRTADPTLAASVGFGMRLGAPGSDVALDANATIVWRPDALGVALGGSYTPAEDVASTTFSGLVRDEAIIALARLPMSPRDGRVKLVALAGGAAHVITIRGTPTAGEMATSATRVDGAAMGEVIAGYALDPTVDVGIAVSGACLLDRQRFLSGTTEVLVIPRIQLVAGLAITMRFL